MFRTSEGEEGISLNSKIKVCKNLTPMDKFYDGQPFVMGTDAAVYDEEEKTYRTLDDEIRDLMTSANFDDDCDQDVDALIA